MARIKGILQVFLDGSIPGFLQAFAEEAKDQFQHCVGKIDMSYIEFALPIFSSIRHIHAWLQISPNKLWTSPSPSNNNKRNVQNTLTLFNSLLCKLPFIFNVNVPFTRSLNVFPDVICIAYNSELHNTSRIHEHCKVFLFILKFIQIITKDRLYHIDIDRASVLRLRCSPSIPFCTYHLLFLVCEKQISPDSLQDRNSCSLACLMQIYSLISVSSITHSSGYEACINPPDSLFKTTNIPVRALRMYTLAYWLFLLDSRRENFHRWFILKFLRQMMISRSSLREALTRSRLAALSSVRMKMVSLNQSISNMPQLLRRNSWVSSRSLQSTDSKIPSRRMTPLLELSLMRISPFLKGTISNFWVIFCLPTSSLPSKSSTVSTKSVFT